MAILVVQRNKNFDNSTNTLSTTFPSNVAGHAIVVVTMLDGSVGGLTTPTDSAGNTYNQIATGGTNAPWKAFLALNINLSVGTNTITAHDGSTTAIIFAWEVSGLGANNPFDVHATADQSSATALSSGATAATTFANNLVLGVTGNLNSPSLLPTVGAGYSNLQTTGVAFMWGGSEENTISASAAQTATFGLASNTTTETTLVLTFADSDVIVLPTVTTQAASSIGKTSATANGNVTATGFATNDHQGVVYDTVTHTLPGNVAPGSSGYASSKDSAGSFSTGAFTEGLTGLSKNATYFYRAYTHNSAGYSYGAEVSFTVTLSFPLIDRLTDIDTGFTDQTASLGDDRLLLEDNVSFLLLEDGTSKLVLNRDYTPGDYLTYLTKASETLTAATTYYWRVRQKISSGSYGAWSPTQSFVPTNAGTTYTSSLSGGLSFTGVFSKSTRRALTASTGFTGTFFKSTGHKIAGILNFVGSMFKTDKKNMTASVGFTGNINRANTRSLTAGLSFTATMVKSTIRSFAGSLGFTGVFSKTAGKAFAAALSFSGTISRAIKHVLTAGISFSGNLNRAITHSFTATLSFTANLAKTTIRAFSGALSFTGAFLAGALHKVALTASVGFSGAFSKRTTKPLAGALSFVGTQGHGIARAFTGALSFTAGPGAGTITRIQGKHAYVSTSATFDNPVALGNLILVAYSGSFGNVATNAPTDNLGHTYTILANSSLGGNSQLAYTFVTNPGSCTITGTTTSPSDPGMSVYEYHGVDPLGTIIGAAGTGPFNSGFQATINATAGGMIFAAWANEGADNYASPATGFSLIQHDTGHFDAQLEYLNIPTTTTYTAGINRVGSSNDMITAASFTVAASGVDGLVKQTRRALAGGLSFVGTISKAMRKTLAAALSFAGNFATLYTPAGVLYTQALTGSLSFTGVFNKRTGKSFAGGLSFTATMLKSIARNMTATLSFTGNLIKTTFKKFTGGLNFSGVFNAGAAHFLAFTASLGFTGSIIKRTNKSIPASVSFTGSFNKRISKTFAAIVSFVGSLNKQTRRAFSAVINFAGSLFEGAAHIIAFTAGLSFSGSLSKRTGKVFAGVVSFSTAFTNGVQHILTFAANLSFAGTLKKSTRRTLPSILSFTGTLHKMTSRAFAAVLSFVGFFKTGGLAIKQIVKIILNSDSNKVTMQSDNQAVNINSDANNATINSDDPAITLNSDDPNIIIENEVL